MLINYFKTAFRTLIKHKSFSFLNIAGLTLGLTATMLIVLFVWDEYRYDKFIPGGRDIYRIYDAVTNNTGTENVSVTPPAFSEKDPGRQHKRHSPASFKRPFKPCDRFIADRITHRLVFHEPLAAGLSALSIALLTVGYQAIRAVTANPVKSLRAD